MKTNNPKEMSDEQLEIAIKKLEKAQKKFGHYDERQATINRYKNELSKRNPNGRKID